MTADSILNRADPEFPNEAAWLAWLRGADQRSAGELVAPLDARQRQQIVIRLPAWELEVRRMIERDFSDPAYSAKHHHILALRRVELPHRLYDLRTCLGLPSEESDWDDLISIGTGVSVRSKEV